MSLIERQRQFRLLLAVEPLVYRWSMVLCKGDTERATALRQYLMRLAEIQVGIVREVRRGWVYDVEVVLVVDEYAETLHSVRRPELSPGIERRVLRELAATLRASGASRLSLD